MTGVGVYVGSVVGVSVSVTGVGVCVGSVVGVSVGVTTGAGLAVWISVSTKMPNSAVSAAPASNPSRKPPFLKLIMIYPPYRKVTMMAIVAISLTSVGRWACSALPITAPGWIISPADMA